jgi:NAD+ synthase (glutamine-hydrolysing)
LKIAAVQFNPIVGDVDGNVTRMAEIYARHAPGCDLVVFPEMSVTGYPPRDLVERAWFIKRAEEGAARAAAATSAFPECGVLFGAPMPTGRDAGLGLYNAAILASAGKVVFIQPKSLLPSYDVFDEVRYFDPAQESAPFDFKGERLGITVCEDAWNDPSMWPVRRRYALDPVAALREKGATLMINISASPFEAGKQVMRFRLISGHAKRHGVPFLYVNQTGGNDELVFDGGSIFVDAGGAPVAVLDSFVETASVIDTKSRGRPGGFPLREQIADVHDALVMGTRDYLRKTGFSKAVLGLSGGIDSAVVCCMAASALGPENVLGISMPSPYSSAGSIEDSRALAKNLGVEFLVVPVTDVFNSYLKTLGPEFAGRAQDITEENIQARIRGNYLMAFSNKFGRIVLSTGNKSEIAVGYCTLYGDMCGGLAVIADVPKTMVYSLADYINRDREIIPHAIIVKAPSAELKPDQKDQDTLPPYDVLDRILHHYIEEGLSPGEISGLGFDPAVVAWMVKTIHGNEHKRRQAAPGIRVTSKAFGTGRRIPIAARY